MSNQFIFPKPKNWDTFEDIICDVFSRKLNNRNFQRFGRGGQNQFGVDIVGVSEGLVVGVQCKHFPNGKITKTNITDEVKKADSFRPKLDEFYFVTSAERDTEITSYVYELSQKRKTRGKFPIVIKFWDDIYDWLVDYPDILYKHFTKYFPLSELEVVEGRFLENNKSTVVWPTNKEILDTQINKTMKGIATVDPYSITLGVTTFDDLSFDGFVDLSVPLKKFLDNKNYEVGFDQASKTLSEVKNIIYSSQYSKDLFVHLQSRLPYAVLLGWKFRKVTGYSLKIFSSEQLWVTDGLPLVFTHLEDIPPKILNLNSDELVFVLNISRNIEQQVEKYVAGWDAIPRAIISKRYLTSTYISPALAMSMAIEISQKIKSFKDNWGVKRIHLFMAVPVGLAALIGYNLNSICPISIYFMDHSSLEFQIGGTLTNNM